MQGTFHNRALITPMALERYLVSWKDEGRATAVEYGLIAALIALIIIAARYKTMRYVRLGDG